MTTESAGQAAGRVRTADGREVRLAMQDLFLAGRVTPAGARLAVRHVFASAEAKPLEVVYAFMLPRDAALRRFEVVGRDFRVTSDLKPTAEAERLYEAAIGQGATGVLARQHEDGLVNLAVGNLRPGEAVAVHLEILAGVEGRDGGFRFRFPFTVAPVYRRGARFGVNERGEGEMDLPASFGGALLPPWRFDGAALHRVAFDLEIDPGAPLRGVQSPSHPLRLETPAGAPARARLAVEGDAPDRDLVLDVDYDAADGAVLGAGGEFVAVVPSTVFGRPAAAAPRRVVFLLDRSGSMQGPPLLQAKRALRACLGALAATDRFSIVAFDDHVETSSDAPRCADAAGRALAERFLEDIEARGGTELAPAVRAAVGRSGGEADLLLLTDGQVGDTAAILAQVRGTGCRLHTLGIGSASQDRFLSRLARDTGGVGRFVTPRERVDEAALSLFAAVSRPVAERVKVTVAGGGRARIEPAPAPTVFGGTPLVVYGRAAAAGAKLRLEWAGGGKPRELAIPSGPDAAAAELARLLRGARLLADADGPAGETVGGAVARRTRQRAEKRLERLSAEYGLASRAMSLVAVIERPGDTPGELPKTVVVPVGLPQDLAADAYFAPSMSPAGSVHCCFAYAAPQGGAVGEPADEREFAMMAEPGAPDGLDLALDLVVRMEPDGGMPGPDPEARRVATLVVMAFLLSLGNSGPFRLHLARLERFLTAAPEPDAGLQWVKRTRRALASAVPKAKEWTALARRVGQGEALRERDLT